MWHLAVLAVLWIGVPLVSIYVGMLPGAALILLVVAYYAWAESPRNLIRKRNRSGGSAR